jgi:LmbE family N-acetylglucosaminyl deacetylase
VKNSADIFVPDGANQLTAFKRTTHLAVVTHQDDLEILAFHGIKECYNKSDQWFTGVVVGDGAGSARAGKYANFTDEQMRAARREEQRQAARLGEYSAVVQLDYSSGEIKSKDSKTSIEADLEKIFADCKAKTIYLHNPCDSHDTHIAVFLRSIAALRRLSSGAPFALWGCEVWRDLDWLVGIDKKSLPVSEYPDLALELCAVFDSQISGGKRYDLATLARRQAHATFSSSHEVDAEKGLTLAMDLLPLLKNPKLSAIEFALEKIRAFENDVRMRLEKF